MATDTARVTTPDVIQAFLAHGFRWELWNGIMTLTNGPKENIYDQERGRLDLFAYCKHRAGLPERFGYH